MPAIEVLEDVLLQRIDDEAVVLNLKTEMYYKLNSTGITMWETLTTTPDIKTAINQLAEQYSVTATEIKSDLNEFIQTLRSAQLIKLHNE